MLPVSSFRQSGRNVLHNGTLYLGWSGSFIEFQTDSRMLEMDLVTDSTPLEEAQLARIAIFIDDMAEPVRILLLRRPVVHLAIPVSDGTLMRTVRIMRFTEAAFGLSGIRSLQTDPGALMFPTKEKPHRIEFIGDSITCGYGVEALSPATFTTSTENPTLAYAFLTASALDAEYTLVAWSGIGLISSWVDSSVQEPNQTLLMSRLYPCHHLRFSERMEISPQMHDFSSDPADLMVINLGTNDSSWTRGIPERVSGFASAYADFLHQVHASRPQTPILCILGTMGQALCEAVEEETARFQTSCPDLPVQALRLPVQRDEDGLGADGHPTPITQTIASSILIEKIQSMHLW